jgi:ceramide glucosyltransferase
LSIIVGYVFYAVKCGFAADGSSISFMTKDIAYVFATGAAAAIAYSLLCIFGALRFLARTSGEGTRPTQSQLPVSILKPLKGEDPEMYESFRSHCLQRYSEYEIIFGVSEENDPAIASVRRLQAEFPERAIRMIVCEKNLGSNTKVSNLAQMLPYAKHEHLLVNDSDIRVDADYLQKVMSPLRNPAVGLVTCLYRAKAGRGIGSRIESLGISTDFAAGVLAAQQLEGINFGLGSTLAFRLSDLAAIGGFEAIADFLADDYELGHRIAALGRIVKLSDAIVETHLPSYDLREFWRHQLRWARTIRDSRPWGYLGLVFTFGIPWSLGALIFSRGAAWAWLLFAATVIVRGAAAISVGTFCLGDSKVAPWLWLLPIRDCFALLMWLASFAGRTILWRGESFTLKNGKLTRGV